MRIGLVAALPEEAHPLMGVMGGARPERAGGCRLVIGTLAGQPSALAWAGAGAERAGIAAEALLQRGAAALFAVGFAGALAPGLRPGDLVVASEILAPGGDRWRADSQLLGVNAAATMPSTAAGCRLSAVTGFHTPEAASCDSSNRTARRRSGPGLWYGPVLTMPRVVTTAAEKRHLGEETGALAVDMESVAVARCAAEAGVPMAALRVITDAAGESLPLNFDLCFDSHGQFRRARLILLLARRPRAVFRLLRLGRHSTAAGHTLASFLATGSFG